MSSTEFNLKQFEAIYPAGIERHYWTLARNIIIYQALKKAELHRKKILEIGSGHGIVVEFLRERDVDCIGVELAPVPISEEQCGYLYSGIDFASLEQVTISSIEVILLFDVIEHIEKPEEFLARIKAVFPNAAHIVVSVPARPELWSNYDEFNGHFRRYTRKLLEKTLDNNGWRINTSSYFFHTLYLPARILLRFAGKRQTTIAAPTGLMGYVHWLLAMCLVIDWAILPRGLFGTSVIAVAERKEK